MGEQTSGTSEIVPGLNCPICRAPAMQRYKPFCSKRCADIDLGRWITGAYVIPGNKETDTEEGAERAEATTGKEGDLPSEGL